MTRHFAITRAQREALFKVFQRDFPGWVTPTKRYASGRTVGAGAALVCVPSVQWRRFRQRVQGSFGCDGMIVLPWRGMYLAIERDGYCHS